MKTILIVAGLAVALSTMAVGVAQAEDKMSAAMKLVGMAQFVTSKCVGMEPNLLLIAGTLKNMGVDKAELTKSNRVAQASAVIGALSIDVDGNCKVLKEMFGPKGSEIPGLIDVE